MAKSVVAFSLEEFDPSYTRVLIGDADFKYTDFTDLGTLELITGDAIFENSQVENLGSLIKIGRDAYFYDSQVKDLGNLTMIGGDVSFLRSRIQDLGNLTTINGNADFSYANFSNLGKLEVIRGNADFRENFYLKDLSNLTTIEGNANFTQSEVENLGNLITIGGNADFEDSRIKNLGNLTTIGGDADFRESQVKSLGNLTTIGGNAYFGYSQVKSLGNLTTINGNADFENSKIQNLGNLTTIGRSAIFVRSQVKDLGNLTTIGGTVNFRSSQVESLGNLSTIGGNAYFSYSQVESLGNLTTIGDDADFSHSKIEDLGKLKTIKGLVLFDNKKLADQWKKISNKDNFKTGGQPLSKTPAPKKDRVYGSKKNKPESSKDTKSAEKIEFNEKTLETIKNKVAEHNENNPNKKVTLASAKAVVRRGMGAYSSTHRPTISGGKPNSRVAWGLARLNAFFYKIINGKSKSGKYSQDDDLINELGYKVKKYADGGQVDTIKNLFLQNGFTEYELKRILEENPNYFNQIEFYDNQTLIVYRTIALPKRLVDKFIKLDKKVIKDGIGEYWTLNKDFGRSVWGAGHYEDEETFDVMCVGHLKIKDIDWEMMIYAFYDDAWHFSSESEIRGVNGGNSIKVVECEELYENGGGGETDEPTIFWGTEAGGVLIYCSTTQRYLILLRSEWVLEPNTWGIISGKLDDEENIKEAVLREAEEETGHKLGSLIPSYIFQRPKFKFHNFISIVNEEFIPELNWENTDYKWVKINEMPENLHFGLKLLLEKGDIPKLVANNVYVEKYDDGGFMAGGQVLNLNKIRKGQYEAKSDKIEISLTNPKVLDGIGTNKWQLIILYGNDIVVNEWFDTMNEALKTGAILLSDFLDSNSTETHFMAGGVPKKVNFDIEQDEEDDRTEISINGIGNVILTTTYPEYEFIDDIDEETLEELGIEEGDIIGKIEHIEIEDKFKGQGYAKLLMNKAIEIAKQKDLMPLYLNASPMGYGGLDIYDLTAFYESFGFEVFLEQGNNNLMILK